MKCIPDKWVVLEFNYNGEIIHKVLGGWYGGYLNGDSWRLNSGIQYIKESETSFSFEGYSQSTYECEKENYGMTSLMSSVYQNFTSTLPEPDTIKIVPLKDITSAMLQGDKK